MIFRKKLSTADATELSERIAEIAATTYPLPDGLRAAAKSVGNRQVRRGMLRIADELSRGTSLNQAVKHSVEGIPPFLVGLLHVGAKQGKLPVVLTELSDHYRGSQAVRTQIGSTLWYPMIVTLFFGILATFVLTLVVPIFEQIYTDFDTELPAATELVLAVSRQFMPVIVPCVLGALLLAVAFRLLAGPVHWSRLVSAIPGFGSLLRWNGFIELLQLVRLQVAQDVPIPESLHSASLAVRDANLQLVAETLAKQVENGWSLADAMESHHETPGGIAPIVRWGEQYNELPHAIDTVTELLTGRIQYRASLATKFLPGVMLFTVGASAAYLVIALMLPLVNLIQNLSS